MGKKTEAIETGKADGVYFGLMSGTSMDGVDGVAVQFAEGKTPAVLGEVHVSFSKGLRDALFALQAPGDNELEREALAANALATRYAVCCHELQNMSGCSATKVRAIGVHGQTVRHRPEKGYTRQINNPAMFAEMTNIDVVADFRSRDVAAGGQGAPLVPAFHATMFGKRNETRVVCNLGGISNITILSSNGEVRGFDCGPANALIDEWAFRHLKRSYDDGGQFAAQGQVNQPLLNALLDEPFFGLPPPKSTGRDLFNPAWMDAKLAAFPNLAPADVQATLTALTARTVAREIGRHASDARAVYVCGGDAPQSGAAQDVPAGAGRRRRVGRPGDDDRSARHAAAASGSVRVRLAGDALHRARAGQSRGCHRRSGRTRARGDLSSLNIF